MSTMEPTLVDTTTDDARTFDWRVYSDATAAGLTALIPVPLVDLAFESTFRRRMPGAIARARGRGLPPRVRVKLGRSGVRLLTPNGCLAVPALTFKYLMRRIWRKIVYVFAVADAANLVSEYWHRAYLLDHMVQSGHLDSGVDTDRAMTAFRQALREADTSPLVGLARQVVSASRRVGGVLRTARRRGATEATNALGAIVRSHWGAAERSLRAVAIRYNELYQQGAGSRQ